MEPYGEIGAERQPTRHIPDQLVSGQRPNTVPDVCGHFIWLGCVTDWHFMVGRVKFNPIGKHKQAKQRGIKDCLAGKELIDNPYLHRSDVALSSWWQTGFLQQQKGGSL